MLFFNILLVYTFPILLKILKYLYVINFQNCCENYVRDPTTTNETYALQEFRVLTQNITEDGYERSDEFLIRFLRVNNLDSSSALKHLTQTKKWREENRLDSILNEKIDIKMTHSPCLDSGYDYEGSPVGILRSGGINVRKLALAGDLDVALRLFFQCLEKTYLRIQNAPPFLGKKITQGVCILDFIGFNLKNHGCYACIGMYLEAIRMSIKHHPGITKVFVIINFPKGAKAILDSVQTLLPKEFHKVPIRIFGVNRNKWVPFLRRLIPPEQLLAEYGGNSLLNSV